MVFVVSNLTTICVVYFWHMSQIHYKTPFELFVKTIPNLKKTFSNIRPTSIEGIINTLDAERSISIALNEIEKQVEAGVDIIEILDQIKIMCDKYLLEADNLYLELSNNQYKDFFVYLITFDQNESVKNKMIILDRQGNILFEKNNIIGEFSL